MSELIHDRKLKVLYVIESCNPDWFSVPLVGYKFFRELNQLVDATLVTHERNRASLEKQGYQNVIYISESRRVQKYFSLVHPIASKIWPLLHTLAYPVYAEFNHRAYEACKEKVLAGEYDLVHAITPVNPRYPIKIVNACNNVPFIYGPVNGGVPFPKGFREVANKEHDYLNFLRVVGEVVLPDYKTTYRQADKVLSGSTYTLQMLKDKFQLDGDRIDLFYENGIDQKFLDAFHERTPNEKVELLFVGRLVPYKGADMLIEAIAHLDDSIKSQIHLTIVGKGKEQDNLETLVKTLNVQEYVTFAGWVQQSETLNYYKKSDLFCFPSVREFGGAVVMEAMACGLPCIVVNNGGIGEYVTEETGFKIEPVSRQYVVQEMAKHIQTLVTDSSLRQSMSQRATELAKGFEWSQKALQIVEMYHNVIADYAKLPVQSDS